MSDLSELQNEIDQCARIFRAFGYRMEERRKPIAQMGADLFASVASASAPRGTAPHKRYSAGKVVATYTPGNLQRAMQRLDFKRSNDAFVGAKLAKGQAKGNFNSVNKADGYYMHMVERGTVKWGGKPFFNAAWNRSKETVFKLMADQFRREGEAFLVENNLT